MADYTIDWNAVEREAVGLLSRYLQIDTTNPSGNETRGAVFLQEILAREGIESDIYESLPGRGSLVTRYGGSHEMPDIILLHHIDVVPAEADKWLHPPFSGLVRDGEIWGRGALDCKSLGIMELMAFVLLKRQGLNPERALVYAATADEEAAGTWGVPWLMKHRPGLLDTRYVINEGVGFGFRSDRHNLHLCQVAEKAACWVRIRFEGRPGHGSLPHEDNCVIDMARAIEALSLHRFPVRVSPPVEKFIAGIAAIQEFMPETEFLRILNPECSRGVLE
ncbi:MAG: M20/M25/M40 family metallo-hydrolase, partial [Deltaproteobacteria bacterium]|nr:M20/M25/M40 family metallo-hydrolase [Deltaproteobacteria bacterium]